MACLYTKENNFNAMSCAGNAGLLQRAPARAPGAGLAGGKRQRGAAAATDAAAMAALSSCNESLGALYFINGRGDVLIQRIYRDDIE